VWVIDNKGNGIDLSTGNTIRLKNKIATPSTDAWGVCHFAGEDYSWPFYEGTQVECQAYIFDLVSKLNVEPDYVRFDDHLTRLNLNIEALIGTLRRNG
jgi:hypothetical protein